MTRAARLPRLPVSLPRSRAHNTGAADRAPAGRVGKSDGSGSADPLPPNVDGYFVTDDAKAASSRATASFARLTESSAPAADSCAVFADCAAWFAEF